MSIFKFLISLLLVNLLSTSLKSPAYAYTTPKPVYGSGLFSGSSIFREHIPSGARYIPDSQLGSIRIAAQAYSVPIYRLTSAVPLVTVRNQYSNRVEKWPIPKGISPSSGSDRTLAVIDELNKQVYELWNAHWTGEGWVAGGMQVYPLAGSGISNSNKQTVSASGFALTAGMITREDFTNPQTGKLDVNRSINHALFIAVPHEALRRDDFVGPAIRGESHLDNTGTIPLGRHYALPRNLDVNSLKVHPFTKAIVQALRDYGAFVSDRAGTSIYQNKPVASFKIESGITEGLFGQSSDQLIATVRNEMYQVIQKYGLYQISK